MKNMSPERAAYEKVVREMERIERDIRLIDDLDRAATERLNKRLTELKKKAEEMTEPCDGEAHSNAFIDNCGSCMGISWGRKLKRVK
jgi:hypothetical protein